MIFGGLIATILGSKRDPAIPRTVRSLIGKTVEVAEDMGEGKQISFLDDYFVSVPVGIEDACRIPISYTELADVYAVQDKDQATSGPHVRIAPGAVLCIRYTDNHTDEYVRGKTFVEGRIIKID